MPQAKGGGCLEGLSAVYKASRGGLLGIPFGSLTMEKSLYDTYCAYHGQSIYENNDGTPKPAAFLRARRCLLAAEDAAGRRPANLPQPAARQRVVRHLWLRELTLWL